MFERRLNDVIALLVGEREESHPGERYVAHAQFFTWASVPHLPAIVDHMSFVAGARLYRLLEKGLLELEEDVCGYLASVAERYLGPSYVSRTLFSTRDVAFDASFIDLHRSDSQLAAEIVRFFVQLHQDKAHIPIAPTMNRAMRFVEENGFDAFEDPTSTTKVKSVWADVARTAPILAVGDALDMHYSWWFPYSCQPVFADPATMRQLLGGAKFIQRLCCELMHEDTLRKIDFPEWPEFITEVPVAFGQFTASQADRIKGYRVTA
ncbi:hypothetical protein NKH34_09100 [Mesorhizobium sp. M1148]|uniref:hypothetical protein n=1 Tax=unclassified Mesorhizobium TaxID=325217 RepID=UPI003338398A